jgi:hypothetical protein
MADKSKSEKSVVMPVRLPQSLKSAIEECKEADERSSVNNMVQVLLREALKARGYKV